MKTLNTISLLILLLFSGLSSSCQNTQLSELTISAEEINNMKYMIEEEKVARDVYDFLGEKWSLRIFNNIKQSEQRHMDMMKNLLEQNNVSYQLNEAYGKFYNVELQKMYNDLITKGSKSIQEALEVGKQIEEVDIKDLEQAIKSTNDTYSINVYNNLLQASYKHLNAFNRNISKY